MELLDLLERRIGDLMCELESLRDENARLNASTDMIAQMRDENRLLAEELEKERTVRGEIDRRIDVLLAGMDQLIQPCPQERTDGLSPLMHE